MRKVEEQLSLLEDTLVSEFRLLQNLVEVTRKEGVALLKGSYSVLTPILEDKETILDQLASLEKTREKVAKGLAEAYGETNQSTIKSLLPYMDKEQAVRVRRLCDGISAMSEQEHVLTLNVNTLAQTWIDMIHSTQAYLLSFYQSPATYLPPGIKPSLNSAPIWATEHRA
jgi:flagellar biosynthesis/type III secretory pathway chaperone